MVVTTTSAAALAAAPRSPPLPTADRSAAMILLTLLAGALMIVAAVARMGRYTRFVPHSVMIGFLDRHRRQHGARSDPDLVGIRRLR